MEIRQHPEHPLYGCDAEGGAWSRAARGGDNAVWLPMKLRWRSGRPYIGAHTNGKVTNLYISRLVLECFVGPRPLGMHGCHNDGDPKNNRVENLRWDTPRGNQADRIRHGTSNRGEKNGSAKLQESDVVEIRHLRSIGVKSAEVAVMFGVSRATVSFAATGRTWKHLQGSTNG